MVLIVDCSRAMRGPGPLDWPKDLLAVCLVSPIPSARPNNTIPAPLSHQLLIEAQVLPANLKGRKTGKNRFCPSSSSGSDIRSSIARRGHKPPLRHIVPLLGSVRVNGVEPPSDKVCRSRPVTSGHVYREPPTLSCSLTHSCAESDLHPRGNVPDRNESSRSPP